VALWGVLEALYVVALDVQVEVRRVQHVAHVMLDVATAVDSLGVTEREDLVGVHEQMDPRMAGEQVALVVAVGRTPQR
jgi:hypothetical protein